MSPGPRVLTGIPLAAFGIGICFTPPIVFFACVGVVILLGAREWARLCGLTRRRHVWACVAIVVIAGGAARAADAVVALPLAGAAVLFWMLAGAAVIALQRGRFDPGHWPRLRLLCGLSVLVPAWSALGHVQAAPSGATSVLLLLGIIWSADIAAYYFGRAFGRTKLCPVVSPGKSVQGAVAGITAAVLLALAVAALQNLPYAAMVRFGGLVAVTAALSIVGDLFESMIKRSANRKDSGTLLPGHGGVLDRIDSLTAAAPVYLLGLHLGGGPA